MSQNRILKKTSSHSQIGTVGGGDDYSAIPQIKTNNNTFQRQLSQNIEGQLFGKQMGKKQQTLSASLSVGINNRIGGGITTAQSVFGAKNQSSSILVGVKSFQNIKQKKNEEGFDGLPDEFEPFDEKNFEEADECFLCFKKLAKKFGGLRKKGRHHCRKCGRTVCDRCRQNKRKLSKTDKTEYLVCDQCDFEIANYHMKDILEEVQERQETLMQTIKFKNNQTDEEVRFYREQKKELQKDVMAKKEDFEESKAQQKKILQRLSLEHEKLNNTIEILQKSTSTEQNRRQQIQTERNALSLQSADIKFQIQQNEQIIQQLLSAQQNSLRQVQDRFNDDTQMIIKAKFEKIKHLSESEMLENSEILAFQDSIDIRFSNQ